MVFTLSTVSHGYADGHSGFRCDLPAPVQDLRQLLQLATETEQSTNTQFRHALDAATLRLERMKPMPGQDPLPSLNDLRQAAKNVAAISGTDQIRGRDAFARFEAG